ncbi:hypothetical protein JCM3765_006154 [Sporobolomyces pararoseus]
MFFSLKQTTSSHRRDHDQFAFCEDAIVYKVDGGERAVGILSYGSTGWEWSTVMGTLVNPRAGEDAFLTRRKKLLNPFETRLALPLSYVDVVRFTFGSVFFISTIDVAVSRAISGIAFANGIVLSPPGKTLAIASTTTRSVFLYSRDLIKNTLSVKPYRIIKLPSLLDNLSVSPFTLSNNQNGSSSSVTKNPKRSSDKVQVSEQEAEDQFELIATGHPSFLHLLATAHQSPPFSLFSLLSMLLNYLPLPSSFKELVKSKLKVWLRYWEFDWNETRGLSWSVSLPNPPLRSGEKEWKSNFMSSRKKKREEGGYGSSSTTILGESLVG